MVFFFLAPDLAKFKGQIEELRARTNETLVDMSEGTRQSSETWHDNYLFEEGQRQWKMWATQLQDWEAILDDVEVVRLPEQEDVVAIGSTVVVSDQGTGHQRTYRIGSYITFEPGDISYASPLGALLIGAAVGDVQKLIIGGVEKTFRIDEINA